MEEGARVVQFGGIVVLCMACGVARHARRDSLQRERKGKISPQRLLTEMWAGDGEASLPLLFGDFLFLYMSQMFSGTTRRRQERHLSR